MLVVNLTLAPFESQAALFLALLEAFPAKSLITSPMIWVGGAESPYSEN
jgi:hypothetical protein